MSTFSFTKATTSPHSVTQKYLHNVDHVPGTVSMEILAFINGFMGRLISRGLVFKNQNTKTKPL